MDYTTLAKVAYECNIHLQENGPNLAALVTMSKKVFFDRSSNITSIQKTNLYIKREGFERLTAAAS